MRSNAVIRIIVWSMVILILFGILSATIALRSANITSHHPQNEKPQTTEAAFSKLPDESSLSFPADAIREIQIAWVAGNIIVIPADVETIEVSESDVSDPKYALIWKQAGNKLEIFHSENHSFQIIGIHNDDYISKDLCIRVPRDWACDSLEIDAASAALEVRNLTIRELDFDGADGTCDFIDCHIRNLDIDTASGDVTFTGKLDSLDFDAASASFTGEFQNTPDRLDMDSMDGKLDIALPEDCGYSLSMDGMSTTFQSEFNGTKNRNDAHIYGDGRCIIQVDGMSCDVTIRKLTANLNP